LWMCGEKEIHLHKAESLEKELFTKKLHLICSDCDG
jgi:hypothetical protein